MRKFTKKTKAKAVAAYRDGKRVAELSAKLKVTPGVIYAWIKKDLANQPLGLAVAKREGAAIPYDQGDTTTKDAILYLKAAAKTFGIGRSLNRGQLLTLLALNTLTGDSRGS